MRWKKWWRRVRDGNMDACRPHGHIPSLLVFFGDRFWLVCRLPVEDIELPIEGTKLPLSLSWVILLTCNVLLATCNYSIEIRFIFFCFFLLVSSLLLFWRQLARLMEVFTLIACPGWLQGMFSPRDLILFSIFFSAHWPPHGGFQSMSQSKVPLRRFSP